MDGRMFGRMGGIPAPSVVGRLFEDGVALCNACVCWIRTAKSIGRVCEASDAFWCGEQGEVV